MARFTFKLPDIGEGIAEAEIVAWHVAIGDRVEEDQNIADMMTDKATVEMESPVSGVVVELAGEVGDQVAIGAALVVIETDVDVTGEAEAVAAPASEAQAEVAEQYEAENPGVEEAHAAGMTTPARQTADQHDPSPAQAGAHVRDASGEGGGDSVGAGAAGPRPSPGKEDAKRVSHGD